MSYIFYKRTQGHGMSTISFTNFSELRDAIGRGSLVVIPQSVATDGNNDQRLLHVWVVAEPLEFLCFLLL